MHHHARRGVANVAIAAPALPVPHPRSSTVPRSGAAPKLAHDVLDEQEMDGTEYMANAARLPAPSSAG